MATSTVFKKGEKKRNQGKRGPGKITKELKQMILDALDNAGGTDYLLGCAQDDKTKGAFLALIGKVLPMTIQGAGANGEILITAIERSIVQARN